MLWYSDLWVPLVWCYNITLEGPLGPYSHGGPKFTIPEPNGDLISRNGPGVKVQMGLLSYGQCGWLKKEDVYKTVCKTSIYPKSKVRPQKLVQSGLFLENKVAFWSVPFREIVVLCPSGNTYGNSVWAWYSGKEWNVVKSLIKTLWTQFLSLGHFQSIELSVPWRCWARNCSHR